MKTCAALCVAMVFAAPARADEMQAVDQFLNFMTNGCIRAIADGTSADAFVKQVGATPAPADFAASLLGQDKGAVFVKDDAQYPIALTTRVNGPCSVNAKFPTANIEGPIEAIHDFIAGPGSRFYEARVFEEAAGTSWVTHRVYVGRRGEKDLTLLFSTHPEATSVDQVMVTVALTPVAAR